MPLMVLSARQLYPCFVPSRAVSPNCTKHLGHSLTWHCGSVRELTDNHVSKGWNESRSWLQYTPTHVNKPYLLLNISFIVRIHCGLASFWAFSFKESSLAGPLPLPIPTFPKATQIPSYFGTMKDELVTLPHPFTQRNTSFLKKTPGVWNSEGLLVSWVFVISWRGRHARAERCPSFCTMGFGFFFFNGGLQDGGMCVNQ